MKKAISVCTFLIFLLLPSIALVASAHSGRTDGSGGHMNHSTGEYHYHHGYSAHDHYDMDGDSRKDCPYDFDDITDHRSNNEQSEEDLKTKENSSSNWELIIAFVLFIFFIFVPPLLLSFW